MDESQHQIDNPIHTRQPLDYADGISSQRLPLNVQPLEAAELVKVHKVACVRLNLEELKPFEMVGQRFKRLGVTFSNAIALIPSNPAYPPRNGQMVMMGAPKNGCLEATFDRPVRYVSSSVTGSRRTVMAAFDANNQPIAQTESKGANLAGSGSDLAPNLELSVSADDIRRVTFYTFDGQLTLGEFSFGT